MASSEKAQERPATRTDEKRGLPFQFIFLLNLCFVIPL